MTQIQVNMAARKIQKQTAYYNEAVELIEKQYWAESKTNKLRIIQAWSAYETWRAQSPGLSPK